MQKVKSSYYLPTCELHCVDLDLGIFIVCIQLGWNPCNIIIFCM